MTRYVITKKYMYLSKDFKGIREILDRPPCLVYYLCLKSLWESILRSAKAFFIPLRNIKVLLMWSHCNIRITPKLIHFYISLV